MFYNRRLQSVEENRSWKIWKCLRCHWKSIGITRSSKNCEEEITWPILILRADEERIGAAVPIISASQYRETFCVLLWWIVHLFSAWVRPWRQFVLEIKNWKSVQRSKDSTNYLVNCFCSLVLVAKKCYS